jgi:hypothetical protein
MTDLLAKKFKEPICYLKNLKDTIITTSNL